MEGSDIPHSILLLSLAALAVAGGQRAEGWGREPQQPAGKAAAELRKAELRSVQQPGQPSFGFSQG